MNSNSRLSFLMSSCDAYEDLWNPFFECIDKFWPDCPYPKYLNTEHKQYDKYDVKTINQSQTRALPWSTRFRDALLSLTTDYVFLVLDDFFLCGDVDTRYFEEVLDLMDNDPSIPSVQFNGTRMALAGISDEADGQLHIQNLWPKGWATHFVPTIWRKSVLLDWLRPWESIWGFEGYGSYRARKKHLTVSVRVVSSPAVYEYLWVRDCSAVVHGKWLDEPGVTDFFANNGIEIDYNVRPKISYEDYLNEDMKAVIKKLTPWQFVVKSFNSIRSRF